MIHNGLNIEHHSFQFGNGLKGVVGICPNVLNDSHEVRNELFGVKVLRVCESDDVGFGSAVDIIVDVDSVRMAIVDEVVPLSVYYLVVLVSFLFPEHHVLE